MHRRNGCVDQTKGVIIVVAIAIALAVGFIAWVFNPLVKSRNNIRGAWADVEVQITKRAELTPQLVAVVQGYAAHETTTFDAVVKARERAVSVMGPRGADAADRQLEAPLAKLVALREAYPNLKADTQFLQLQINLSTIEDDLAASRRFYNGHVRRYEDLRQSFPRSVVAPGLGFDKESYFRADLDDVSVPVINLDPLPPTAPPVITP